MNKAISISLAKIDYDAGKPYIKIIADNPMGYVFTKFIITVYLVDGNKYKVKRFDASSTISGQEDIILTLPVSILEGIDGPAIYDIQMASESALDEIQDRLYLSDANYVYRELLNDLLSEEKCLDIDDSLIKKYLILYGHQQALQAGDLEVAKELFLLMNKGFSKCGNTNVKSVNCGCNA